MHKKILIAIGITFLFLGTCINPTVAIDNVKKSSTPISSGNTLYVGGSGSGNYTTIQEAVENASDGDTVFVYSGNYNGLVSIKKSLNLIGEDRNTTIISGPNTRIWIEDTNNVNIQSFTIMDGLDNLIEIRECSNCTVYNNFLQNDGFRDSVFNIQSSNIKIIKNYIKCDWMSVEFQNCKNCIIENNKVGGNERWSVFSYGILIYDSKNITVKHNQISKASTGIEISSSKPVYVIQNNFVRNFRKSRFDSYELSSIIWDGNYWGRPRIFPKMIFGIFTIIPTTFSHPGLFLPWFQIDRNPAKEPYDIGI